MSIVQQIVKMLEPLPATERLLVLREAEKIVRSQLRDCIQTQMDGLIRKVTKMGKASYRISIPSSIIGREVRKYKIRIVEGKLVYEPAENEFDAKFRAEGSHGRLSIPKWAYEQIGCPLFVVVRVEGDRIIVEPARVVDEHAGR